MLEELKAAFCADDAPGVRKLLAQHPALKARINEPFGPFDSPPVVNVRSRAMLDVLLEAGADINAKSQWWAGGFCLLDCAPDDLAAYAIERGAVVEAHAAARLGMLDRLQALCAKDPSVINARGGDGKTPLHFARNVPVAEFLLAHGAQIDALDIDHESTPAQHLIGEHPDVVRFLVARGCVTDIFLASALGDLDLMRQHLQKNPACVRARVNAHDFPMSNPKAGGTIYQWTIGFNLSPHETARKFGHPAALDLLMQHSPPEIQLLNWCWLGEEASARRVLVENPSATANLSTFERRSVALAARNNNLTALRLLLEAGLPHDVRGQHNATPLHWAAWHGNAGMVKLLLEHGAKEHLENKDNDFRGTPLDWAKHGTQNGWHRATGDYPGVLKLLGGA